MKVLDFATRLEKAAEVARHTYDVIASLAEGERVYASKDVDEAQRKAEDLFMKLCLDYLKQAGVTSVTVPITPPQFVLERDYKV